MESAKPRKPTSLPRRASLLGLASVGLDHVGAILVVLLAGGGFVVAVGGPGATSDRLARFLVALALTQLAITFHNAYCDRQLDALTKPWRSLPQGDVSAVAVLATAAVLAGVGLAIALTLGLEIGGLVGLGTSAGFAYNAGLKRGPWAWVPFWLALPTLAVCSIAVADHLTPRLWAAYLVGAPLALSVALVDALGDVEADRAHGVLGVAHRLGVSRARAVGWLCLGIGQALAALFWPTGRPGDALFAFPFLASLALLAASVVAGFGRWHRAHWLFVMLSIVTLGLGWLLAAR